MRWQLHDNKNNEEKFHRMEIGKNFQNGCDGNMFGGDGAEIAIA
jgi:hypothetical protein